MCKYIYIYIIYIYVNIYIYIYIYINRKNTKNLLKSQIFLFFSKALTEAFHDT